MCKAAAAASIPQPSLYDQIVQRRSKLDAVCARAQLDAVLQDALATARGGKRPGKVFLELFAGSKRVSAKWRAAGCAAVAFELADGAMYDLANPIVSDVVKSWIRGGFVGGVWLSTPCSTWSLARRGKAGRPGGPLRKLGKHLMGHPDALARSPDCVKIFLGNDTMTCTAQLLACCIACKVPCALENPMGSRLFHAAPIAKVASHKQCRIMVTDLCMHGAPWRKATKIMSWFCKSSLPLQVRCQGRKGRCASEKRKGRKHVILQGSHRSGITRTARASVYPWCFAEAAAEMLMHA